MTCPKCQKDTAVLKFTTSGVMCRECHSLQRTCSADFWCVRFETLDGAFHPIWFGAKGGPGIEKSAIKLAAEKYLSENSWLKCINDIYPPNR
jgi:hypothetical protein